MTIESKFSEKEGEEIRDETLKLKDIDTDYLERRIQDDLEEFRNVHEDFFKERKEWILGMRDLKYQYKRGYFDESSDLHVPYSLIMHKAMHARIFQVFSQRNFFAVESNNEAFSENEETVKNFMNWVLTKWMNRGRGKQDVMDTWISDILEEGSGILKSYWDTWEHNFVDIELEVEDIEIPNFFAGEEGLEVEEEVQTKAKYKNIQRKLKESAPASGVVSLDDFFMPPGQLNVQQSPWVAHRVRLRDDDLKLRASQGRYDKDIVQEALDRRLTGWRTSDDRHTQSQNTRRELREMEGLNDPSRQRGNVESDHEIFEWYGRVYVEKDASDEDFKDMDKMPEEVVIWYHGGIRKILGWTYLHRIAPSGKRPFYKADFMPSKERSFGIGVGELLFSLNNHIDGVHNLKMDNGVLASMQFGVYRAGSTFKPDTFKMRPGDLLPVEDTDDVKFKSIPYLGQFGENEELVLNGYGEKLLAVNDINLGNLTGKGVAGALRNATGANFVDRQANIQLHPHLDRISRELADYLSDLFIMTRSRMSPELYFRVTGEDGKGFFGDIAREDLRGNYDFIIDVDVAASSEAEKQQRVTLMLQTLLNPTFLEMGLTQPGNLYELVKEYLIRHQIRNPDKYITKPADYRGPPLTPDQRIMKIMLNTYDTPPVEDSVRPEEDHERALETYQEFEDSELFGILDQDQLAAFVAVREAHKRFFGLVQGGAAGVPNMSGTQMPGTGGLEALGPQGNAAQVPQPGGSEGGPLGSPQGEPNGPIQ